MQALLHVLLYTLLFADVSEPCISPIVTEATGLSVESIYVSWLDFGNPPGTRYDLEFVPVDSTATGQPTLDSIDGLFTTVTGLVSGTEYNIYIRALCMEGPSEWTGPVKATTFIENGEACGIALHIPDDNCPEVRSFAITVDQYPGLMLGADVYLASVDLIVEHPWMADLTCTLRSPSGATAVLMANHGVGVQNIGEPLDSNCTQVLSLTMSACDDLTDIESGQIGAFLPDVSLNVFHDQGSAEGTWYVDICDKASDDIGKLRYIQLNFTENACDFSPTIETHQVLDTIAVLNGLGDETCDTLLLIVWDINAPGDTTRLLIPCTMDTIDIAPLLPGNTYTYTTQKICGDDRSTWSCPQLISTTCDYISLGSGFDENADCVPECGLSCPIADTLWANSDQDNMDWTAFGGSTATEFTGPGGPRYSGGKYLYTETSGAECQDGAEAILLSRCLRISGTVDGCDLSFWYHMYGESIGSLILEISLDGGSVWNEILQLNGNHGDTWNLATVNLFQFNDTLATLRFRAVSGDGFLGDIAIDDIMFFGTTDGTGVERCYFLDADMDGFGNDDSTICICSLTAPYGYTTDASDCDDSNPEISPDAMELPCNVMDDNCNGEIDEGINPDPVDYILIQAQDASCTGINDGRIEITATGGTGPYTYLWNTGSDTSLISDLSPGIYQCTITDENGCIAVTEDFEIQSLIVIEYFVVAASDPSCIGQTDGFISGIVQGGTMPYVFEWNNGDTTRDITGLADGNYQVTITDAQGCWLVTDPVSLAATSTISVNILQLKHVSCHGGNNGSIRLVASGGAIPPYHYQWSNGDTTALTSGLSEGNYSCTIVDSLGCMVVAGPYLITEPAELEAQVISAIPPLCNSSDDGSIQLSVNGGTSPYFYVWSHGAFSEDVFQLTADEYSVTVSDLHGCDTVLQITLISPDMLEATLDTVIHVHCPGDSTGSIAIDAFGGTLPYRYDWSTGATDSAQLSHLPTGLYSVTLSDASGCKSSIRDVEIVASNAPLLISIDSIRDVSCYGDSTGLVMASVVSGTAPYAFNWSIGIQNTSIDGQDTLDNLPAGEYRVTVTDANGCTGVSGMTLITEPTRLTFVLDDIEHNVCNDDSLGSISISVEGGTPPYRYQWSHGDTTEDIDNLSAGTFSLEVTDSLGCSISTQDFEINEPDSVVISFDTSNEMGMQSDGWALVFVTGGTPPYTYQWDTAAASSTALATNLTSGTYTVTVTDDVGCEYVDSVFVDRTTSVIPGSAERVRIFPNPAKEYVIVEGLDFDSDIKLFGIDGKMISCAYERIAIDRIKIELEGLPASLYFIWTNDKVLRFAIIH